MKLLILSLLLSTQIIAKPKAEIAIVLDTSGSMQSLIQQVRDGLWKTINNLGELERNTEKAALKIALYEYGSGSVDAEAKFIRQLVPLTEDHALIAEKLFSLKAQGSVELMGEVLRRSTNDLKWSSNDFDFKSIIIAGNETIYQGEVDPLQSAQFVKDNGIFLNTVFAGAQNSIFDQWQSVASFGGGDSTNIDHNNRVQYIETPFDAQIVKLNKAVVETYMPYGVYGQREFDRLRRLDSQISQSGFGSYIEYGNYRSGGFGSVSLESWDLVTAYRNNNPAVSYTHLTLPTTPYV